MPQTKEKPKEGKSKYIVTVGSGAKDAVDLVNELEERDFFVDHDAQTIIGNHFPKARVKKKKLLETKTAEELGFKKGASLKDVCLKLKELGYKFGDGEDGGEFAKSHPLKEKEGCLMIMSDPVSSEGEIESIETMDVLAIGMEKGRRFVRGCFSNKECGPKAKFLCVLEVA